MRARLGSGFAVAVIALSVGCGGRTTTVVKSSTVTQTTTSQSTAGGTSTATTTPPVATTSQPPMRFVRESAFQSPSGNIGCALIAGIARCDIVKRHWSPPQRPVSCPSEVDFGQGLEMSRSGPARFVCAGDTARDPSSPKLPYGTASQVGAFVCVSRSSGMTCTNRHNGHGFFISIQGYRLF